MKKKLLSIILTLCMVLTLLPVTALAVVDTTINISAIAGVTAPVAGGNPVKTITECDQYTGTVEWSYNPDTFATSTTYNATITLTPKTGYTLTGVTENFFTVAGANIVINSANSGEITAVFPATGAGHQGWFSVSENGIGFNYGTDGFINITMPDTGYTYGTADNGTAAQTASNQADLPDSGWNWAVQKESTTVDGVTYDYTLTLRDFDISNDGNHDGLMFKTSLNLELIGTNVINTPNAGVALSGYYDFNLRISGVGSLTAIGFSNGICSQVGITIAGGTIEAHSTNSDGIVSGRSVTITAGTVTASGKGTFNTEPTLSNVAALGSKNDNGSGAVIYDRANHKGYKWFYAKPGKTVNYVGNDSTDGSVPDSQIYASAETVTVPGNTGNLVKSGFTFAGWNDGTNTYQPGASYNIPANNVTFTAQWTQNAPPTATVQAITGTLQVGETLTGHYTYSDVNGDLEGISTYKWYRADDALGSNKTVISGATAKTYVLQSADKGKYISFEVTPVAAIGIAQGTPVESTLVGTVVTPPPPSGGGSTRPALVTKIDNGGSTTSSNISQLISGGKTLTVAGDKGAKLVFNTEALKGIYGQTSGSIKVEIKDVSHAHQENLSGKQVFSLTVSSGGSTITNFGGAVTVTLPYTLKSGETAQDVTVWYLAGDGTMTEIPCTYDPITGLATFTVTHFSLYVVGVEKPWVNPFSDVKESDWFYGAVEFANRNGLFAGTDTASFSPNSAMTRAMLWTVLGRLNGQSLSGSSVFEAARNWAMKASITDGTSPDGSITREQMVTILWRYAGSPKTGGSLSAFSDAGSVTGYAADAMAWAMENGIVSGSNGALLPQDSATRAQVAAILQRFIEATAK